MSIFALAMLLIQPAAAEPEITKRVSAAKISEPKITETFNYYDVSGSTVQEVRANLNRNGPLDKDGKHFDAVTRWYIRWRYNYENGGSHCAIATVSSSVEITITFPRLSETAVIPDAVRQAFADYTEKLMLHEKGHAQNGIDTAKRIEGGIAALAPADTCSELGQAANKLGYAFIEQAKQWDIDYDLRTRHGATQGARFPRRVNSEKRE